MGGGGGGSVKAVIVDSVSAVIAPVLGGKQNEGDINTPEAPFTSADVCRKINITT